MTRLDREASTRVYETIFRRCEAGGAAAEIDCHLARDIAAVVVVVVKRRVRQAVADEFELRVDGPFRPLVARKRDAFTILERPRLAVHRYRQRGVAARPYAE